MLEGLSGFRLGFCFVHELRCAVHSQIQDLNKSCTGNVWREAQIYHRPRGKDQDDSRGLALARVGYEWQDW